MNCSNKYKLRPGSPQCIVNREQVISPQTEKNSGLLSEKSYLWGTNDKLLSVIADGKETRYEYDGVYNYPDSHGEGNYTGFTGIRGGTNTVRDRLMQQMRSDRLSLDDIPNLTI